MSVLAMVEPHKFNVQMVSTMMHLRLLPNVRHALLVISARSHPLILLWQV